MFAVTACRRTIADNGLGGRVTVYHSDNLMAIPIEERWDLVVGNPPFFDNGAFHLRAHDRGWRLHREFFATIGRFLRPGGKGWHGRVAICQHFRGVRGAKRLPGERFYI